MVDEGLSTTSYALDEALIDFGAALDDLVGTKLQIGLASSFLCPSVRLLAHCTSMQ